MKLKLTLGTSLLIAAMALATCPGAPPICPMDKDLTYADDQSIWSCCIQTTVCASNHTKWPREYRLIGQGYSYFENGHWHLCMLEGDYTVIPPYNECCN